jgi:hypothetical protein
MFQRLVTIACGIGCLFCLGLNTVVARQDNSANPLRKSTPSINRHRESVPNPPPKTQANDGPAVDATQELKLKALTQLYPTGREGDLSDVLPPTAQPKSNRRIIPIPKPTFSNHTTPVKLPAPDAETSPSQFDSSEKPVEDHHVATTSFNGESESVEAQQLADETDPLSDAATRSQGNERTNDSQIPQPTELSETQSDNRLSARKITLGEFLGSPDTIQEERKTNSSSPKLEVNGSEQSAIDELTFSSRSNDFVETIQRIATGTCLVLVLGVGFILVAKRFSIGKPTMAKSNAGKSRAAELPLNVRLVGNFKLSAKSNLQIIEVGDQKFLIANDATGIKSVVPIGAPFVSTLDDLASAISEKENDERDETVTYTPSARLQTVDNTRRKSTSSTSATIGQPSTSKTNADVEEDMRRQLAELLGGQAFKNVFYQQSKTAT